MTVTIHNHHIGYVSPYIQHSHSSNNNSSEESKKVGGRVREEFNPYLTLHIYLNKERGEIINNINNNIKRHKTVRQVVRVGGEMKKRKKGKQEKNKK